MFPSGPCNNKKFYIYSDGTRAHAHTHTLLQQGGWNEHENEMEMTMKWQLPNRNTRWGTQKKKGKEEKTPTPTHLAQGGRTLKGQGRSGRTTGQTPTRGGGADGSAWHNLQERRTQTWLDTGARMKKGTHGELVNNKAQGPRSSSHNPLDGLSGQPWN